jgi:parvulin-like peptidyl-prolyl isomerase
MALLAGPGCQPSTSFAIEKSSVAATEETAVDQITAQTDKEQLKVTRSQKPEADAPRLAASKSLLDLASHNSAVPNGQVAARIRATVNGDAILDEEVREAIYPFLLETQRLPEPERSQRRKEIFEKQLQQIIERELILQDMFHRVGKQEQVMEKLHQYAEKEFEKRMRDLKKRGNLKSDEDVKAYLRSQGLTIEGVRRQVERNFMAQEWLRQLVHSAINRLGHEQILEYYQKHPEEFKVADSVIWEDIFIDANKFPNRSAARQFADQLAAKARAGANFQELVNKHDQGDSSYRNGEGYGRHRGEIKPPEAEAILFKMKDGQIGPVVELTNGFHIIRLVKREFAGQKPFDEKIQAAIRNKLEYQVFEREQKRLLADLKRKATIQISSQ